MHQWLTWPMASKTNCMLVLCSFLLSSYFLLYMTFWLSFPFCPLTLLLPILPRFDGKIQFLRFWPLVFFKMSEYNILSGSSCLYSFGQTLPLARLWPSWPKLFCPHPGLICQDAPQREQTLYTLFLGFSPFRRNRIELSTWLKASVGPLLPAE